jgi:16S rRNA (guanine966-N2)-methyltransferase
VTGRRQTETRVIAGDLKGRRLAYPDDPSLRPTMQRAKKSVFDKIEGLVRGAVFVDLYAAAGGIGIEALSRGAASVHFVERDEAALRSLARNLEDCRIAAGRAVVHRRPVMEFCGSGALRDIGPGVIWADPPYETGETRLLLEFFAAVRYPVNALLVIEHRGDSVPAEGWRGLDVLDARDFGQSRVTFVQLKGDGS